MFKISCVSLALNTGESNVLAEISVDDEQTHFGRIPDNVVI